MKTSNLILTIFFGLTLTTFTLSVFFQIGKDDQNKFYKTYKPVSTVSFKNLDIYGNVRVEVLPGKIVSLMVEDREGCLGNIPHFEVLGNTLYVKDDTSTNIDGKPIGIKIVMPELDRVKLFNVFELSLDSFDLNTLSVSMINSCFNMDSSVIARLSVEASAFGQIRLENCRIGSLKVLLQDATLHLNNGNVGKLYGELKKNGNLNFSAQIDSLQMTSSKTSNINKY